MESQKPQAKVWRERAEKLRVIADSFTDPTARSDLVQLAEKWEKMAERERRIKPRKDGDGS